jgi:hypothetical protein
MTQSIHDRNATIIRQRAAGATYAHIARQHDITRQRAHQIVEAAKDAPFLSAAQAKQ